MKVFEWKRPTALAFIIVGVLLAILVSVHLIGTLLTLGTNAFQIPDAQFWLTRKDTPGVKMVFITEQLIAYLALWLTLIAITLAILAVIPPKTDSGVRPSSAPNVLATANHHQGQPTAIPAQRKSTNAAQVENSTVKSTGYPSINEKIAWVGFTLFTLFAMLIGATVAWYQTGEQTLFSISVSLRSVLGVLPVFGIIWFAACSVAVYRIFSVPKPGLGKRLKAGR